MTFLHTSWNIPRGKGCERWWMVTWKEEQCRQRRSPQPQAGTKVGWCLSSRQPAHQLQLIEYRWLCRPKPAAPCALPEVFTMWTWVVTSLGKLTILKHRHLFKGPLLGLLKGQALPVCPGAFCLFHFVFSFPLKNKKQNKNLLLCTFKYSNTWDQQWENEL